MTVWVPYTSRLSRRLRVGVMEESTAGDAQRTRALEMQVVGFKYRLACSVIIS